MRDEILDYLVKSGFVENYVKKLLWPPDMELLEDFIGETWLQIVEIPETKWNDIMEANTNKDPYYGVRNFVSVVIRNTVRSTTSAAYRRLKKQQTVSTTVDENEWQILSNTIEDSKRFL